MKFKRRLLPILAIIIVSLTGYLGVNKYQELNDDSKYKITLIVNECKGHIPDLQTDQCNANWLNKAYIEQREMMDKILEDVTITNRSINGKPDKYIMAAYTNMRLYIPYDKKNPQDHIVIEIVGTYFDVTGKEEDIATIIEYMRKQGTIEE